MPVCQLRSMGDLGALKAKTRFFTRPASFRVKLLCETTLHPDRQRTLERRLAFCLSDCGCALAAVVMILIPVALFWVGGISFSPLWPNAAVYALCTAVGAVLAKLGSLSLSYRLAHSTIEEMLRSIPAAGQKLDRQAHAGALGEACKRRKENVSLY